MGFVQLEVSEQLPHEIPRYWGTPIYGNVVPYTGIPQYTGMLPQVLGFPSIYSSKLRDIGVPRYMEMYSHILGYPSMRE
jgi:hypothetical protein